MVDGPAPQSCPDAASGFGLNPESVVTSEPTVISGGFYVNDVYLPITPPAIPAGWR